MKRVKARGEARKGHRNRRPWRLEMLESRLLLSGQGLDQEPLLHLDPAITLNAQASGVAAVETSLADSSSASAASSGGELAAATTASSSVPVLNSLPGAAISLYLDFDGDYESQWGSYGSVATPAFDQDGNPGSFNTSELATIREIWQYVAEDYAPFQVNVTTVEPTSFANGAAIRVAIGGDGAWLGGQYGGISYIDSFSNSMPNTVFVFAENLGNGNAKYVGDAASHEAGHAFGLVHQSEYDANGVKIEDYSTGPGDGRAPLMGDSYAATRSLWWNGTSGTSANSYQDDMAELGQTLRYRRDDHSNTLQTATSLVVSGGQFSGSGLISATTDADLFSFTTGAGQVSLTVDVPAKVQNLDARLQLLNANGTVLATADPSNSFGASITATLSAGTYYLRVASHGNYGDVGSYTVRGTVASSTAGVIASPTNLAAKAVSTSRIDLTWTDNATNETAYRVERSNDGSHWATVATLAANSISYQNTGLAAGTKYYYRVRATNASGSSNYSTTAIATTLTSSTATLPAAPTNLIATIVSSRQVDFAWQDRATNETGFRIERYSQQDGRWVTIGSVATNVTRYSDTTVVGGRTYYYRIRAVNTAGSSAYAYVVQTKLATAARAQVAGAASHTVFADHAWLDRLRFDWS
jgi:hypothetical protein